MSSSEEMVMFGTKPIRVVDKLPTPEEIFKIPRLAWTNMFAKVFGPSFIVLGGAIGSGEWLMGPSVAAAYGLGLSWLVWVGMIQQTVYYFWLVRLTAMTGEPGYILLARLSPKNF
jgi:Mn2+/Fe2+ NRAMP family transporter